MAESVIPATRGQSVRRVLMIGGATYADAVICPLSKRVRECGGYAISVLGAGNQTGRPIKFDYSSFDAMREFPSLPNRLRTLSDAARMIRHAASCLASFKVWSGAAASLWKCDRQPVLRAAHARASDSEYAISIPRLTADYDIHHWHCLHPSRLAAMRFLPKSARIIVSILGSDLLRTAGVENYRLQLAAIERATFVTMASHEMREIFLAKFGRQFHDKVRLASYGADYVDQCAAAAGRRNEFLGRIGIPLEKTVVSIGHNGFADNQHLRVIDALGRLDRVELNQIAVLLPMTYGAEPAYVRRVQSAVESLGVPWRTIVDPLSVGEVALLRAAGDVFVHVPVSDHFSSAMCESISAGAVLITGSWLPYGRLRTNGIHYHEVAEVADVAGAVRHVLHAFDEEHAKTAGAAEKVRRFTAWERVLPRWLEIYDELVNA